MAEEPASLEEPFVLGPHLVTPMRNRVGSGDDGQVVPPKVMQLLCLLASKPGETVTRERLVDEIWDGRIVSDAAIDRVVCNLRKILGDDARHPEFIETVRKKGLRLMVAVRPAAPSPTRPYGRTRFGLPGTHRRPGRGVFAVAGLLAMAGVPLLASATPEMMASRDGDAQETVMRAETAATFVGHEVCTAASRGLGKLFGEGRLRDLLDVRL